ncbi:MAG TPA: lamin tail domain-containing protein [Nocardioides sp.]|nr:lamin tail domain-containing protein [Nocardioides sp.]
MTASLVALALGSFVPAAHADPGGAIRITEFAYGGKAAGVGGGDGEYVELTNVGDAPQDLTGWTYDNSTATAATGLSLSGLGTVAAGESVIVTDLSAAEFRAEWGLKSSVKVLSNGKTHTLNSGPNSIHVYDKEGLDVDSVSYASGVEAAKGLSAWVDAAHVGAKSDTTGWTISTAGDAQGSWASAHGSVGSPGASTLGAQTPSDVRATGDIKITELAYGGLIAGGAGDGEYVELTNVGEGPQDMTGWSYDNVNAHAGAVSLSGFGTVAPGESVIVTDADATAFRTDWGLEDTVKIVNDGAETLNKGPNAVHIYDSASAEVDSVTYASGFFPAKGVSAWVDTAHLGAKSGTLGWTISTTGDAESSWKSTAGSVGSPGASTHGTLTPADVRTSGGGGTGTPPTDPNYADIAINEITSDNSDNGFPPLAADDLIELHNTGTHDVSLAGWRQTDSNAAGFGSATDFSGGLYVGGALSTVIPAGGYGVFSSGPGLSSGGDAVSVYTPDGILVDSLTYTAGQAGVDETINTDHTYHALAACPDGSNSFLEVPTASFGGSNATACQSGVPPLTGDGGGPEAPCQTEDSGDAPGTIPADALAWPGDQSPATIDAPCSWVTSQSGQDLSGLAFDPMDADVMYAVKNKSHVYRLVRSGGTWVKDTADGWADGKELRFPGDTGLPDSEGLTVGPDGSLYVTTERDNAASGVPLDTILEFDPTSTADPLVASDQWVLTPDLGFTAADANLGFEGVTYVPDSFLTRAGFRNDDGTPYDPAAYPGKALPGLFFAAVEKTGHLRAYELNTDHTYTRVADIDTGMAGVMDVSYDADLGRIWAHCDNTCGNATALLGVGHDGHFAVLRGYNPPTNLPNYNLEGFAVAPVSTAANGSREVLWTDDGNRFGHSLWSGTIDVDLGLAQSATPTPTIGGTPFPGGHLTANVGTWDPGVTTHYQWKDGGAVLAGDQALTVDPSLLGRTITLAVTGSKPGFADATTTATLTITAAVWGSTNVYDTGDFVSYQGTFWKALWYTRNEAPGSKKNGAWQEWVTADDGNAVWTATRVFDAGDEAWYQGRLYLAQWYSRGDVPGAKKNTPWKLA